MFGFQGLGLQGSAGVTDGLGSPTPSVAVKWRSLTILSIFVTLIHWSLYWRSTGLDSRDG